MSRPSNAKYCPRCGAMNYADAEQCRHCQHQFRTGMENAPAVDELHRTQMFHLPPLPQRVTAGAGDHSSHGPSVRLRAWIDLAVHSPLLIAVALLVILALLTVFAAYFLGVFTR